MSCSSFSSAVSFSAFSFCQALEDEHLCGCHWKRLRPSSRPQATYPCRNAPWRFPQRSLVFVPKIALLTSFSPSNPSPGFRMGPILRPIFWIPSQKRFASAKRCEYGRSRERNTFAAIRPNCSNRPMPFGFPVNHQSLRQRQGLAGASLFRAPSATVCQDLPFIGERIHRLQPGQLSSTIPSRSHSLIWRHLSVRGRQGSGQDERRICPLNPLATETHAQQHSGSLWFLQNLLIADSGSSTAFLGVDVEI